MSQDDGWPLVGLSDAARLRMVAAAMPGLHLEERLIDAPFERVWGFVGDVERSVPQFDRAVRWLRIVGERDGGLDARSSMPLRLPGSLHLDMDLHEGWCWMATRPRGYVIGMAAEPAGPNATRFVHVEGVALPGPRWAAPLLRPLHALVRRWFGIHVRHDLEGIVRAVVAN